MKKILLLSVSFALLINSFAQKNLNEFINAPNLSRANISILVKEIESGEIIMEHRSEKVTTPASTTKLVTTATALEMLGPNYAFETKLQYDGKIRGHVLEGNIYILGSGDPTLGSRFMGDKEFLKKWTDAVKQLGITVINGRIVADPSLYSSEGVSPKWPWEDLGNYYAAGAYGLSIYDNQYNLSFKSGAVGSVPLINKVTPSIPELNFKLALKAGAKNKDSAYIYGAPFNNQRFVYGSIPANKDEFIIKGDIPNPPLYLADLFMKKLEEKGIEIRQNTKVLFNQQEEKEEERTDFFIEVSPNLDSILTNINQKSNNHYAEHVFRHLSLENEQVLQANSTEASRAIVNFWGNQEIETSGLVMYDGCGLSPSNAISAKFFVDLLIYEKTISTHADAFISTLAVAGESGTLKRFLKGTRLKGKVQAKSGSIRSVQCFAGYLTDKNDKQYAFAILVDNYSGIRKKVVKQIENLLLSVGK